MPTKLGRAAGLGAVMLVFATQVVAQTAAELAGARTTAREGVAAYRKGEWANARRKFLQALSVQPAHPVWLYDAAAVSARMGDTTEAVHLLDSVARLGFVFHPGEDGDFAAVRSAPEFASVARRLEENAGRIGDGEPFATLPDVDFLPEGIAYDSATGSMFIGSVHQRRVVRVRDGVAHTFADSTDGLWSVLGMAAVSETRSLWLVTTATEAMRGRPDSHGTALVELDLDSGRVRRYVRGPGDSLAFNDLTIDESGSVFISETNTNAVYRWNAQTGLHVFVPPGVIYNPSGLARLPGTEWLYVADYPVGMTRVSVRDARVERIAEGAGVSAYGADGVMQWHGDLVVIQNALPPHRVTRLHLSPDGRRIERADVLERGSPWFSEPTLGVIVDGAVLYVANSRWGEFRNGRYEGPPNARGPVVLRLPMRE